MYEVIKIGIKPNSTFLRIKLAKNQLLKTTHCICSS